MEDKTIIPEHYFIASSINEEKDWDDLFISNVFEEAEEFAINYSKENDEVELRHVDKFFNIIEMGVYIDGELVNEYTSQW